jgi:phosphatidylinositol dimannoside acyltransferase
MTSIDDGAQARQGGSFVAREHPMVRFWVAALCFGARRLAWPMRLIRPLALWIAWVSMGSTRVDIKSNMRRVVGPAPSSAEVSRLARSVVASFYDFIFDLARLADLTAQKARARISSVEGREHYEHARAQGHGVILVTAHLGSFEVALASLAEVEPRLHVVFRRDEMPAFERSRSRFRSLLGVAECPVDEGIGAWARLRDALAGGATVLIQGDRVVAGQQGIPVRFCHGRILAPTGPVKLARLAGAPIVPAASVSEPDRSIRILIGPPIDPPRSPDDDASTLQLVIDSLADFVARYPGQWLTLHRAFLEDPAGPGAV